MADDIDRANELADREREACIRNARATRPAMLATGCCHFCEASVPTGHLFCDADCRDDYERENRLRKQNGGFINWDVVVALAMAALVLFGFAASIRAGVPVPVVL